MHKMGAYRVYTQSNYNIGLVMHLLNHSSESMTLVYLGLEQASQETMLDQIDFRSYCQCNGLIKKPLVQ